MGSRWANVHWGLKRDVKEGYSATVEELQAPPTAAGFELLAVDPNQNQAKELGWVDEGVLKRHCFPPGRDTRVMVCGLPGVYTKLCGPRTDQELLPDSVLARLGFQAHHVIKF